MGSTKEPTAAIFKKLRSDFKSYTFSLKSGFSWSSSTRTITHAPLVKVTDIWLLLHEIAHAELDHTDYSFDVELVRIEAEAWQHAQTVLAPRYSLVVDAEFIEDALDTYRQWLHSRSLCPKCDHTGIQQNKNTYSCINCRYFWRVNDARLCALRRIRLQG